MTSGSWRAMPRSSRVDLRFPSQCRRGLARHTGLSPAIPHPKDDAENPWADSIGRRNNLGERL
jgi:hypothetical protein